MRAAELGVINSSDILPVYREYKEPSHVEFKEPPRWSLLNAFTETVKKYPTQRVDHSYLALNRAFGLDGLERSSPDGETDEPGMDLMQPCRSICILEVEGVQAFPPAFFYSVGIGRGQAGQAVVLLYRKLCLYYSHLISCPGSQMRVHVWKNMIPCGAVIRSNQPEMMNFL